MKLKNRIMSWILSPGAYMVWHALGTPEEWASSDGKLCRTIKHVPTGTEFWFSNGAWFFDGWQDWERSIGLLDRHVIWHSRARNLRRQVRDRETGGSKKHKLFVKFTQLTGKQQ